MLFYALIVALLSLLALAAFNESTDALFILFAALVALGLAMIALAKSPRHGVVSAAALILSIAVCGMTSWRAVTWREPVHHDPARCASNLNGIGKALLMYVNRTNQYPSDLSPLAEMEFVQPKTLQCPTLRNNAPYDGTIPVPVDYFYLAPGASISAGALVACDFRGNHDDGRNVLYAGGSVKAVSEAVFREMLARPENQAFAAGLAAAEKRSK